MVEPVIIGNATLYLGDAQEIVPTLAGYSTVVSDPLMKAAREALRG